MKEVQSRKEKARTYGMKLQQDVAQQGEIARGCAQLLLRYCTDGVEPRGHATLVSDGHYNAAGA